MKKLTEMSAIKEAFEHVHTTENISLIFKCALRDVPKIGKVYVVYPVLYPASVEVVSDYFADMTQLGYNVGQILRNGYVLFCNKHFVPSDLVPNSTKRKNPTPEFENALVKNLTTEKFMEVRENWSGYVRIEWDKAVGSETLSEFISVPDAMGKELNKLANALLGE